jgi:uncharacterized protein YciI
MGRYACLCTIDEAKLDLLSKLRADHYAFLVAEQHRIHFGGPARITEGGRPETMIMIVEAANLADAEAWIAGEPYTAQGGFKVVAVRPWSQVIPETEPGLLLRTRDEERARRGAENGGGASAGELP